MSGKCSKKHVGSTRLNLRRMQILLILKEIDDS